MKPAPVNAGVEFDDFKITHTKSNLIQANEYYPFGLQTANSWTRENTTGNNFLGNGGTELNATSNLYDLEYRNYDPALGRMHQVDPMTDKYASHTPYNFAFNDPITFNDPSGADPDYVTRRGVNNPGGAFVSNPNFGLNLFRSDNNSPGQWGPNTNSLTDWSGMGGPMPIITIGNLVIDLNVLSDGAHVVDFTNGVVSNYTYYSNNDITNLGSANFNAITGISYNNTSDYTGGSRLMGDKAGTIFFGASYTGNMITSKSGGQKSGGSGGTYMAAALVTSGVLLADDATVVGTVDDILIPFLMGAAYLADLYSKNNNKNLNPEFPGPHSYTKPDPTNSFYNSSGNRTYNSGEGGGNGPRLPPEAALGAAALYKVLDLLQDSNDRHQKLDELQKNVAPQDATKYYTPKLGPR